MPNPNPSAPHPTTCPTAPTQQAAETTVAIHRFDAATGFTHTQDQLATEAPLELRIKGQSVSITMRTPSTDPNADREWATGFLLGEGIIQAAADIVAIEPCPHPNAGDVLNVYLKDAADFDPQKLTRHVFATSSCGVCGKAAIDQLFHQFEPLPPLPAATIDPAWLCELPNRLQQHQPGFANTGSLHAAALHPTPGKAPAPGIGPSESTSSRTSWTREDVGRHNAVDKAIGAACLAGALPLSQHALVLSGRAPFEILQKAIAAQIRLVVAVGAPSSMAVELADAFGVCLVGFVRGQRFNVYSHAACIQKTQGTHAQSTPL